MSKDYTDIISKKLSLAGWQVENTLKLFAEGATVPFVSRYRKEATGSLDEIQLFDIQKLHTQIIELDKRREAIHKSIEEQGKLTDELRKQIENASTMNELEDIYLPYKQKKKTRASVAREKGLEPLAQILMKQQETLVEKRAGEFLTEEVASIEDALQGARDIIAEWVSENKRSRESIRRLFSKTAIVESKVAKGKEEEGIKYKDYFEYSEPLGRCPSHRLLAMFRGEDEGFLKIRVEPDREAAMGLIEDVFVKGYLDVSEQVRVAVQDSYKRLLQPSIETEFRKLSKVKADEEAIKVFAENLRQLLMAAPLGEKAVLALDPGFRTGCKLVCLDAQGNLLHNATIYPHPPQKETGPAMKKVSSLVSQYKIEAVAIGNGTASRETEQFIRKIRFDRELQVFVVNESGASIYSASKIAREEFPEFDVTVRGAVSIGRRLMDPLAELVKLDPKSIGVGQYQHDVDQGSLKESLDQVVESSVNKVGVNLNTASKHLLTYISGLGPTLAQNIVDHRRENGPFSSRKEVLKVARMGEKAFEQSAGFLRIPGADQPLDDSAVHPESYKVVERMASDLGCSMQDLVSDASLRSRISLDKYISDKTGMPTLKDILEELAKPGRDPRSKIKVFEFAQDVQSISDLKEGMVIPGIVTNITNFGAFVDVGVKQDGLVHISQLADRFISDPNEVVKIHEHVKVKVVSVDIDRKRIQLSMKEV
ncbi:MAG TPA: RNA-binding transcriptional accessory protein [Bacteroides sp.]|nr:RNA-binding transcriptional accessory protein [Bacteroides sp.]